MPFGPTFVTDLSLLAEYHSALLYVPYNQFSKYFLDNYRGIVYLQHYFCGFAESIKISYIKRIIVENFSYLMQVDEMIGEWFNNKISNKFKIIKIKTGIIR